VVSAGRAFQRLGSLGSLPSEKQRARKIFSRASGPDAYSRNSSVCADSLPACLKSCTCMLKICFNEIESDRELACGNGVCGLNCGSSAENNRSLSEL